MDPIIRLILLYLLIGFVWSLVYHKMNFSDFWNSRRIDLLWSFVAVALLWPIHIGILGVIGLVEMVKKAIRWLNQPVMSRRNH